MKYNSQLNEDFCTSPHFFVAQGLKDRGGNNLSKIKINSQKDQESYFQKREKSFVLDCNNKLKLPKDYNSLYDKYLVNFLCKNSTLTDLKRAGIICKYQQDGNHLILFEHGNIQPQQQRRNYFELQENVELLQKKKKKQNSLHNFSKLPEIPNTAQELKDQNQLSNRSRNNSNDKLAQIKEHKNEKTNNESYDEKYYKQKENSKQSIKQNQKNQSVIKISTTKQMLNQINVNTYSKDSTQSSDQKHPTPKYVSNSYRNRNQSSHQIGQKQEKYQFDLKISPIKRKQVNSVSQSRNSTHRANNSIENSPESHIFNSSQQKINSSQQVQLNSSCLNSNVSAQTNNNLSAKKSKPELNHYQTPNGTLKFKLLSSHLNNNKYSMPQIKTLDKQKQQNTNNLSIDKIPKEENSKQADDDKKQEENIQAISKDDFLQMIQRYKLKVEQNLSKNQNQEEGCQKCENIQDQQEQSKQDEQKQKSDQVNNSYQEEREELNQQ